MRYWLTLLTLAFSLHAGATATTSDISDMWWNPAESGWGANIILQNDIAFMTFFVYDANQNPVWYTSDIHYQGSSVWTGTLYATKGPYLGGVFTPSTVTIRPAGTVRFALSGFNQATLAYTVDGVTVSKALQRQTWANQNFAGTYAGGYSIRNSSCAQSSLNGIQELAGLLSVSQSGSIITVSIAVTGGACSFGGAYTQVGRQGSAQGSYSCTDGAVGTFTASEMTLTPSGFTGYLSGQNQQCRFAGTFGGIARAQ